MDNHVLELERAIANLKANITVLENNVAALKEKNNHHDVTIAQANTAIMELRLGINDRFNEFNSEVIGMQSDLNRVKEDIDHLSDCVHSIETKVDKVHSNSLLEFTSELDIKKLVGIFILIASLISSPTIVNEFLEESSNNNTTERIDRLIELLESDAN